MQVPDYRALRRRETPVNEGLTRRVVDCAGIYEDPASSEEALSEGEGGACFSLLRSVRQGLPRRNSAPRINARPRQCGCGGRRRGDVRSDRGCRRRA